jgi:hypothetical protein
MWDIIELGIRKRNMKWNIIELGIRRRDMMWNIKINFHKYSEFRTSIRNDLVYFGYYYYFFSFLFSSLFEITSL